MIDRGRALEQQWAERYVAGQLTPDEVREFEEAMLEHPEVLEQVELARTVKLGLKTLRERGELDSVIRARAGAPQWWFAAAAVALICAFGFFWLKHSATPAILALSLDELATGRQSLSQDFLIARTRGSDAIPIEASATAPVVTLRILVPTARVGVTHEVALVHRNERIAKVSAVPVGDYLTLYLDTSTLENGDYELRLAAANEQVPEAAYPLHFTRK